MNLRICGNSIQANCLSLSSCLILKKWRLRVISVKKKYRINNNLKLNLILTHHGSQALRFFIFLKGNGVYSFFSFLHKTQNSVVWWDYITFSRITKKTNHIDISLTGTDNCNSVRFDKKYIHLLFSIFQKNLTIAIVKNNFIQKSFIVW